MKAERKRPLTERQKSVMKRIDLRVPIKVIAQELGVSETRINQHIRALKDIYKVDSLNELVEQYRLGKTTQAKPEGAFSESAYRNTQLSGSGSFGDNGGRVDPGEIVMSDVMPMLGNGPWNLSNEPRIVPGVLDGENAVLARLAVIVGITFGIIAAIVLTVTAAMMLSEAMEGKATIPVENNQPAG
jgi:biotin operon repressor